MVNGIPPLLTNIGNVVTTVSILRSDAAIVLGLFADPQWGVFNQDGSIALQPDSIIDLDFKKDWQIPNYRQEQGAFQTYNKITLPYDIRVRMTKGGTDSERANFLLAVESAAASLNLYEVVTPEITYPNANITHYDYRRTSTNGVGLLTVDLWLLEVRVTATVQFQSTAAPSGTNPTNDGNVLPQVPTTSQSAAATAFQ